MSDQTDVLVIGAGLAGGVAALKAADDGAQVTLLEAGEGASRWSQGGIVYRAEVGDPEELRQDILAAGCGRNSEGAVDTVVREGASAVERWLIERLKVPFDRTPGDAGFDLAREAAHSRARILHWKDSTGVAVSTALDRALSAHPRIRRRKGLLVDLLISDRHAESYQGRFGSSRVNGAYVFDETTNEVNAILAGATVLATGGFSRLYLHATGPASTRGDGIAAAHRAGARTLHLEYVQFHPTALFLPEGPRRLLTEALRGAGAKLLTVDKTSFVDEMAPRDVVSRAIHEEMLRSGAPHVWFDLRPVEALNERFPSIVETLRSYGFDPNAELIPVVPAAHYTLGGVWTDLNGATSLPGLFAAGEVACTGLHGASRLASTSLLEGLVFGERAGAGAAKASQVGLAVDFKPRTWRYERGSLDPALLRQDWALVRQTLWNYVGLVRSERRLRRAERILVELRTEIESFYKRSVLNEELIGLRNAVLVANLVLYAALRNKDSVGAHYLKEDY